MNIVRLLLPITLGFACGSDPSLVDPNAPPDVVVDSVFGAIASGDDAAVRELVREDYIQHSSLAADGIEGLFAAADFLRASEITRHRTIVEGDRVALHQTYVFPDGTRWVAFDVFRVEAGRLAEHWDALQMEVPASETVSGRSMTDGPTTITDTANTVANRALVTEFIDVVLTQGRFDEIGNYISSESYAQHNPGVGDGIEGVGAFAASLAEAGLVFAYTDSPLVVAEGNFVFVGSEGVFGPEESPPYAIFYDLFRVEDGLIVEHWDVIPPSPDPSTLPHDNGFF